MKRILSLLLMLTLIFSILSINTFAATNEELLLNGDFESKSIENFKLMGKASYEVDRAYAHDGNYGLLIKDRQTQYSTYYQDILPILQENGSGIYRASMWIKLAEEYALDTRCMLVIRFQNNNSYDYITSDQITLTTQWQQCTFEGYLELPEKITSVAIYQQSFHDADNAPDVCVDSMSFVKLYDADLSEDLTGVEKTPETTVGAIRWDAWYSHTGKAGDVVTQVERSLSPAQFHFRAPFFAEITEDNKIVMPEYTQDIFDREMEYAMYAGIDYFSYVWYNSDMKMARKFHEQSQYKNDVKMCVCFDGNAINQPYAREEMRTLLLEDYYMTVLDGRPLMYYFATTGNTSRILNDIIYYEELCEELGIKKPFAVVMNISSTLAKGSGGSAVSKYGYSGTSTYADLVAACQNSWLTYNNNSFQYVPNVTLGWQPEPRYVNPVSWTTVSNNSWAGYASDEEILDHFAYALSYLQHDEVEAYTKANTMLAYAWNEHDEGGWICPTLEVDENGNQLYNSDGTKKINENRINAVKEAVDFFKNGKTVEVTVNGISNGSTIKKASETIENLSQKLSKSVYEGIDYDNRIPKVEGATLDIGTSLTLNYYVDAPLSDDMTMRFTSSSGKVTEVKGVNENGSAVFSYKGINPQCMSDTIKAELLLDGKAVDVIENYSVKTYCDNLIARESSLDFTYNQLTAFRALVADMLTYGAASQEYRNYNTQNPADSSAWVKEYKSTFYVPEGVRNVTGNSDLNNCVTALGVNVSNVNKVYFKMKLTDAVTVLLNGKEVDLSTLIKNDDGTVTLYSNDIYATGFDDIYTLKLVKDDIVITTVEYNVNAYISKMHENNSVGKIVKALSNYGASAINFKNSLIPDNNFDLEDDIL